ncbi:MAG: tRNA pseudouridine(38-40) synthase TruA [Puniceicoccales bacterium]|jgi:tRNA pseudouridine38-40 synthase|nr:tRNA pseudouridine(38-40) synthase TruA [Puniceicoccales bacterium]
MQEEHFQRYAHAPDIRQPRKDDLPQGLTRFVCKVAYDGTNFYGWQSQACGKTIQDTLERRISKIFLSLIRIHGSGRTDSGVHATGQVFHFDAAWNHSLETLHRALRSALPDSIRIISVKTGRANFHARYSAFGKRYCYNIYEGYALPDRARYCFSTGENKLDTDAMSAAASLLLGIHDFSAFCGRKVNLAGDENPVKDLRLLKVTRRGARIVIATEASGYLYKMVRRLAGGLMQVGLGNMKPQELLAYRDARIGSPNVPSAPARGLTMEKVFYRQPNNQTPPLSLKTQVPPQSLPHPPSLP